MPDDLKIAADDKPAVRIIKRFGGLTKAARAWNKPKSTVQRWKESGYIHPDYHDEILRAAVTGNVLLDAGDFNLVSADHPAFNAPKTPSPDSTADRTGRSDQHPTPETVRSLAPGEAAAPAAPASADSGDRSSRDPSEVRA